MITSILVTGFLVAAAGVLLVGLIGNSKER